MVALPYRSESKVVKPAAIGEYGNGKIPAELLHPCGIRNLGLAEPAARACRALVEAAKSDGVPLNASGGYRSYEAQKKMFLARYTTTPLAGRNTKTWEGQQYWLKPKNAMAATPGRSNHGWGLALDFALSTDKGGIRFLDASGQSWLAEHGPAFGFWNSVKSEVWHWPYFPGDDIPEAVLQMERDGRVRLIPDVPSNPKVRVAFYRELPFEGVLSRGARGPGVEAVQWASTAAGFRCGVDGVFGPMTERAIREFQTARGLPSNGLVDEPTWEELGLLSTRDRPQEDLPERPKPRPPIKPRKPVVAQHGAIPAAVAAYRAGFRGGDLATIVTIAGRESGWQSDASNPRTSDRGMWQINFGNLSKPSYDELRDRLDIERADDLLALDVNAAVAFSMYEHAAAVGKPWFPWRGSETGAGGHGPGWDPDGSHLWRTKKFAAEAKAAAQAVLDAGGRAPGKQSVAAQPKSPKKAARGSYTITAADADGVSALVGRCVGIEDAPWAVRRAAAEAVAAHTDVPVDTVWNPGDTIRFPASIPGVRSYTVQAGDGPLAIASGLGLGRSKAAVARALAINAWQGSTPHPGDVWYGGAA